MPISIDTLRSAALRSKVQQTRTLTEARSSGLQTVFLCHSHQDELLVRGVLSLLEENGWRVYVDWADASMPETPSAETAARIKKNIADLTFFLFLATPNSMSSKWCPWEIGYADGTKNIDHILLFPTTDGFKTYGSEYLQIYPRIDFSSVGKLGVWRPGQTSNGIFLENLKG